MPLASFQIELAAVLHLVTAGVECMWPRRGAKWLAMTRDAIGFVVWLSSLYRPRTILINCDHSTTLTPHILQPTHVKSCWNSQAIHGSQSHIKVNNENIFSYKSFRTCLCNLLGTATTCQHHKWPWKYPHSQVTIWPRNQVPSFCVIFFMYIHLLQLGPWSMFVSLFVIRSNSYTMICTFCSEIMRCL